MAAIEEIRVEASEALASAMESSMQVTRLVVKAKVANAKVKRGVTPLTGAGGGEEVRPPNTPESVFVLSKICLSGVNTCLMFLEYSIPLEIKEEALARMSGRACSDSSRLPCW